jgi:hypothetical protein
MDRGDTAEIDPAVFDRNLAALRELDPSLADCLASRAIPDNVIPCRGRDGLTTFRIRGDDGREHWFGGTSAPTVSAPAMLAGFDAGTGNVLLPGIGHGTEASLLLQRLEAHRGVLVLESDPLALALALRLHDYHEAILEKRFALILSSAEAAEDRLRAFLFNHDGYCCPERMLVWPWQAHSATQPLQSMVERCATAAIQHRGRALAEVQGRWRKTVPAEMPATPRVAVVARMVTPVVWRWAEYAATAGRELGWTTEAFIIRGPADCHILRLARGLHEFNPDWVLAIGATRNVLTSAVAPGVPIAAWLDSLGAACVSGGGIGSVDSVAATSAAVRDRLPFGGMPKHRVTVVPHAAPARQTQGEAGGLEDADRPYDAVILLDVAPANPQDAGVTLHTQQVLWRESVSIIRRDLDSFTSERAEPVLATAEARVKMTIREPAIRKAFVQLIADVIGPTTVAVETGRQLVQAGVGVHVWGSGWDKQSIAQVVHHGGLPSTADLHALLGETKLYICAGTTGDVGLGVLEAVSAGAVILWRQHPSDNGEGGIRTLFAEGSEFMTFRSGADLIHACKTALGDPAMRGRMRRAAVARLGREHAPPARLKAIQLLVSRALRRE